MCKRPKRQAYLTRKEYAKAEQLYSLALAINEKKFGPEKR
jgi:hypothetical protein